MATTKPNTCFILYFFSAILLITFFQPGFAAEETVPILRWDSNSLHELPTQGLTKVELGIWKNRYSRRLMIGSTAPTCTYNECRGCRYKCRAEQIPVDANDPINSAYHYRCVCHR